MFTLTFEAYDPEIENYVTSRLQLVDLAGSERVGMAGTTGQMREESVQINQSLLTLRKVINGLSSL